MPAGLDQSGVAVEMDGGRSSGGFSEEVGTLLERRGPRADNLRSE